MPVPYGSTLHIPPTSLLLLAAKQVPYKKPYLLTTNMKTISGKSSGEWASRQNKRQDRKSHGSWQKNKRGDSKVAPNDSPEIPDGGRHQTSLASLWGSNSKNLC